MARTFFSGVIDENGMRNIALFPRIPESQYGSLVDAGGQELDLSEIPRGHIVFFLAERWQDGKFVNATYVGTSGSYFGNFICETLLDRADSAEAYIQLHPDTPEVGE